ncbi:hypothetical protein COCMIDRAFT_25645 [Bipolaris oryzae ATCC 44560]|uniref:Uncharacterized protein n=1 Tax=Bipolaris oryzae ATCC 44560 TaxID=930090 RepID=W6Z983_COCMI|nr:uncharacterized protein COCMIDRAFT_25645 [Bipolaris oryzae ATCC 44560]EUC46328.1 hypothetical protein COCMIDRAFT_25645 [Bipolaris oryzae ATCC 44560]
MQTQLPGWHVDPTTYSCINNAVAKISRLREDSSKHDEQPVFRVGLKGGLARHLLGQDEQQPASLPYQKGTAGRLGPEEEVVPLSAAVLDTIAKAVETTDPESTTLYTGSSEERDFEMCTFWRLERPGGSQPLEATSLSRACPEKAVSMPVPDFATNR